ncbi:MAG: hypothetical protein ABW133_16685, partial [Polyangiaceae bacterium]
IRTSQYALDLFTGPVFAGSRVTGLAGAYVAIAEDVDGDLQNPASPAVRPFFSYTHFDYWLGFGLTFPATLENTDFFNSGSKTHIANAPDSFVFLTPAVNVQLGELGIGVNVEFQNYALSQSAGTGEGSSAISATIPTVHLQVAHGFDRNQWVFGAGVRLVSISIRDTLTQRADFVSTGNGFEFGGVYKPERHPLRLGLAVRTAIRTEASYRDDLLPDANGDLVVTNADGSSMYLPKAVACPWDVNFGFAVQFGRRPFNPPWRTSAMRIERQTLEHRIREIDREAARKVALREAKTAEERQAIQKTYDGEQKRDEAELDRDLAAARDRIEGELTEMNRFYVQLSAALLVSGPVESAVGVESLVTQTVNRSGERAVSSPRVGLESGGFLSFMRLRGGAYLEPTRFDGSSERLHGTFGVDIKLVRWNVFGAWPDDYLWRLGLGADAARQYSTWGITLAGWYPRHTEPKEAPGNVGPTSAANFP